MSPIQNPVPNSTSSLTPEQQVQALLHQQIANLSSHHVAVSYTLILVLVFVLGLAGFGGWIGLKFADKQIARAEAAEERSEQLVKSFQQQLAENSAQRAQDTKQQQAIVKIIDTRDTSTDTKITQVLSPTVNAPQAITDLNDAYKGQFDFKNTPITTDGRLTFPVPMVQQFSATKIDRDRLFADREDIKSAFALEQNKTKTLNSDLKACQNTLDGDEKTIKEWKKAAKDSRFKKVIKGVGVVALAIGAAYLGHKL
jgi:hypothetical protein